MRGDRGAPDAAWTTTLSAWMAQCLQLRRSMNFRNVDEDVNRVATHIDADPIGALPLALVSVGELHAWMARMLAKNVATPAHVHTKRPLKRLSARTVNNALSLVRQCLQHAFDIGLLPVNPARDLAVPRASRATTAVDFEGVLAPDEQARLLAALPVTTEAGVLVRVALGLGLRRSELLSLRRDDVDVDGPEPFVVVRYGKLGGPTKGGRARRLPLFGLALDALLHWLRADTMPERSLSEVPALTAAGAGHREGSARAGLLFTAARPTRTETLSAVDDHARALIFPGPLGGRQRKPPAAALRAALARAGVQRRVRWHDLRHTCGTSLLMGWWGRQWSIPEVQRLLGHASAATTERYLHARNELVFRAAREHSSPVLDGSSANEPPDTSGLHTCAVAEPVVTSGAQAETRGEDESHPRDLNPRLIH